MEFTYKLLALDLDGTLTDSRKEVPYENAECIKRAMDKGVRVVLASGRPVLGIKNVAEKLRLYERGGYILAYNGGHIIDCKTGADLRKQTVPAKFNHEICSIGKKFNVHPLTYSKTGVICEDDQSEFVKREGYNNTIPVIKVKCLENEIAAPVVKFMVVGEPEELQKAYRYLINRIGSGLNIFFSEPYFLEITPAGTEKASALGGLCDLLHIRREETIACGDGLNDIPMLRFAGMAVAMENACKEVREMADFITLSNDDGGVACAIKRFILNNKNY